MKKKEILDSLNGIPEIIESSINMTEANASIKIHEGEFILKTDSRNIRIIGVISFNWGANSGAHFSGEALISFIDYLEIDRKETIFQIIANDLVYGEGFITSTEVVSKRESMQIKGTFSQNAISGDKSIAVDKIIFSIPNLREFFGMNVKKITPKKLSSSKNRLILENENYVILIDKCQDYKEKLKSVEEKGGYIILYYGELRSKKGSVKLEDTKDIFHCLSTFLTFLNGKRTSAYFLQGMFSNQEMWCDFTHYFVDSHKNVRSWPQRHSIEGINKLWQNFSLLWKEPENKSFLTSAIHWYVEANVNRGFSEGAIIMSQTALELLYNWWIIERKKMITGKDSENINASNKIRLLLSQLRITHEVPSSLLKLQKFVIDSKDVVDAPDAIVQIRNAIVHSQEEKRKKLSAIHSMTKYEALQLCIWYIELTLLCILNFDEKYSNRCSETQREEMVPWTSKVSR